VSKNTTSMSCCTFDYLVYGSALVSNVRLSRPARHIACPQRLKYIHGY
jgi:hypothetical protein